MSEPRDTDQTEPVDVTLDVHNGTLGQTATTPGDADGQEG